MLRGHVRLSVQRQLCIGLTLVLFVLGLAGAAWPSGLPDISDAWGPRYHAAPHVDTTPILPPKHGHDARSRLADWTEIALTANALDHTPVAPREARIFGEQFGPVRTSRALAIVHIAIFDAVSAITGGYQGYTGLPRAPVGTSMAAAIAQAAHDTLVALYPSQAANFDAWLADDLSQIPDGRAKAKGINLGQRAAAAILALRADDGSQHAEPHLGLEFVPGDAPGDWRQDPISQIPIALGAHWGGVQPFVLASASQFRVPPPPHLESPEYAAAVNEVRRFGGDGVVTPTERADEETLAAIYWAYDGTPGLGTPPRLYNQIALHIAARRGLDVLQLARLLALLNVAMADTGIATWESKYCYQLWRPITGIREADTDGNDATAGDPTFTPLGAPVSNLDGPNFTPPFPAYPSGHAAFGAALFQTLRNVFGTDEIAFTFVSDELNGLTRDNQGHVRPIIPRRFLSLSEAEEENGQSRIASGIHFTFDKDEGIALGRSVADYVFLQAFVPLRP